MSPAPLLLSSLDQAVDVALDPAIVEANGSALRRTQPDVAAAIASAALPDSWRPALALDGWLAMRSADPTPTAWLSGSAAPRRRALGLLRGLSAEGNVALPSILAGAELRLILDRTLPHQAVFVFEADVRRLAAVLRLHDFSREIGQGRVALLPQTDAGEATLTSYLRSHPGVLPPQKLVSLPGVSDERMGRLRAACEQAVQDVAGERDAALADAVATLQSIGHAAPGRENDAPQPRPALAVLALRPAAADHALAERLEDAARQLGLPVACRRLATPADVHPAPLAAALAALKPRLAIEINAQAPTLPFGPATQACTWHTHLLALPSNPPDGLVHLAATPRIQRAMASAGGAARRVLPFYFAAPQAALDAALGPLAEEVVLVADCPDASAEAARITQPTHKMLWNALLEVAEAAYAAQRRLEPAGLLTEAERRSGVSLREPWLREQFARLVEHNLIPAVLARRIAQGLAEMGLTPRRVGRGWATGDGAGKPWAYEWGSIERDPPAWRPRAAVVVPPPEGVSQALVDAAARGWPIWIFGPDAKALRESLGGVLEPDAHFEWFDGPARLRSLLNAAGPRQEACAARARTHLAAHHTQTARLRDLLESLGVGRGGASA